MKKQISEIFWLRSVACMTIVFIHALTLVIVSYYSQDETAYKVLRTLQLLLMYGTPMFVFISEFLLSYSYKETVPKGFFKKRFQFIFLPYVIMGLFYGAYTQRKNGVDEIWDQMVLNVVQGQYHGYFVLIIFQFYVLHILYQKLHRFIPMKVALIASLFINVAYLSVINFVDGPTLYDVTPYVWNIQSRLPFLGWIFYFTVGFYAGRHYNEFKQFVVTNIRMMVAVFLLSVGTIVAFYWTETLTIINSKRVDVMFLTLFVIFILFYLATKMKRVPKLFMKVSQYSFGIYLLHPFFQSEVMKWIKATPEINGPVVTTLILLGTGIVFSMIMTHLLNYLKVGKYIIGKVNVRKNRSATTERSQAA
ncbi:acyltransferase family protein [Metabacillus iocasae]|uniref:Membrane-bound acyltransferase YfiQ involved in biofilm formation n=1 Tax=Priestia iocasae TaxID=2291674 RepID=A0ABS2QS34_9BACI|nr:acyltransferase family protein [Metabacillus iocasae]MBM7702254.1 membrane-bound acyltransferase YfiQ involved in biofilm formation [Metabacillus iocasae]